MLLHVVAHPPGPEPIRSTEFHSAGHPVELAILHRRAFMREPGLPALDPRRWARPGIYFLLAEPATPWPLYVGSSGDLMRRMVEHVKREFPWQRALLACLPNLPTGKAEQLEGFAIRLLRDQEERGRIVVETERAPGEVPEDRPTESELRTLMQAVELALQLSGLPVSMELT